MRTTLSIDDDVLRMAKLYAAAHNVSIGAALSTLARRGIVEHSGMARTRDGVLLLPVAAGATGATLDEVNRLRDEVA